MLLKELFERENVSFPEWLSNDFLKGDWENSVYLKGENIHKWELITPIGMSIITFENYVYTFAGYDEDNNLIFEKIVTSEETMIS